MKTCPLFASIALVPAALVAFENDDPRKEERDMLRLAAELADSENHLDRVHAADILIGLESALTPASLLEKLIADQNPSVQAKGYIALGAVSQAGGLAIDDARRFSQSLREEVSRTDTDRLLGMTDEQLSLLVKMACALDSLYCWYPLVSLVEAEAWQRDQFASLLTHYLIRFEGMQPPEFWFLVNDLRDPGAIAQILPRIVENLQVSSPEDCRRGLVILWSHHVFGNGQPMNANLRLLLRPISDILREKVATDVEDESDLQEVSRILEEAKSIR